jgi:hypothetical protein
MKLYWNCIIGPVESKDLDYYGGDMDYPMRDNIKKTFSSYFDTPEKCISGWNMTQEKFLIIKRLLKKNSSELQQALNFLEKRKLHDDRT